MYYNMSIFLLFFGGSALGIIWTMLFLKKREALDFRFFDVMSKVQSKEIELLSSIEEIKVSNSAKQKRWEWEEIQAKLFKVQLKSTSIQQWQQNGQSIISQLSSILITVLTAKLVIDGNITLGSMFAINMIVGQLGSPIQQILAFIPSLQDAKLSLRRINEVHIQEDEDPVDKSYIQDIPSKADITIQNLYFSYSSVKDESVLKNLSLTIPAGKVTAIVGASGSGKTTLLKLLLKFHEPSDGKIMLGNYHFNNLQNSMWRQHCGVVMQQGAIFSDTIANNIAVGQEMDTERVIWAAKIANIEEYISQSLPLGFLTKIGNDGMGLSIGQKQRILLARAVYKNPDYLFLDEATSALDAKNEREVMEKMNHFFEGRTVVVIAHRLSTVKNADQIIALHNGEVVEVGSHNELVNARGYYYNLVKDQLELGS